MLEQALGWLPLGLGVVVEDEPSELSCICTKWRANVKLVHSRKERSHN